MKIYDCFIFFNELELLELRLMTLYDVVDYFVIVESSTTFTGKEKEYYYGNNAHLFSKYSDKIIHVKLGKLPYDNDAWNNEYFNRNAILQGITNANEDDYIMVSDVDEIPNPNAILSGINSGYNIFTLKQKLFYYYVNCEQKQIWSGTMIIKRKYLKTPQELRKMRNNGINNIENGGWHYSFLGGSERIKTKLEAYSETQTNIKTINNEQHIKKCLETGFDLFHRNEVLFQKKFLKNNELTHPQLSEWLKKYPQMIKI